MRDGREATYGRSRPGRRIPRRRRRRRRGISRARHCSLDAARVAEAGPRSSSPGLVVIATLVGVVVAHRRDVLAKTVVLFYELESDAEQEYQELHNAFGDLLACHAVWHVEAAGATGDWKRSGGATATVRRKRVGALRAPHRSTSRRTSPCPPFRAGARRSTSSRTSPCSCSRRRVSAPSATPICPSRDARLRFVEDAAVPSDAEVVGSTWQYVNRSGGPDRRFNNNRQIPLVLYDELHLRSTSGLDELLQLSRSGAGERLGRSIARLGREVRYSAEPNGRGAGAANDQPSVAAPESPSDLRWTGTWTRVSEAQRLECESPAPRRHSVTISLLASRGTQALGRCSATGDVLYWIPAAPSPLVVVHYSQPDSEGRPTNTYYQGATAWNKWVPGE